jgi:hypothetical protein
MALAAPDAQVMYDSEQEKDYESGERHSRKSTEHDHSDSNTNNQEIEYRYLDWDTNFLELCTNPDELPKKIVKTTNPFEWGPSHKNWVLAMCCASTFVAAYMPGAYTSGLKQMEAEWNMSRVPLLVGVTTYTAGFAVAPMMLAPLSEVGTFHLPCFNIANNNTRSMVAAMSSSPPTSSSTLCTSAPHYATTTLVCS